MQMFFPIPQLSLKRRPSAEVIYIQADCQFIFSIKYRMLKNLILRWSVANLATLKMSIHFLYTTSHRIVYKAKDVVKHFDGFKSQHELECCLWRPTIFFFINFKEVFFICSSSKINCYAIPYIISFWRRRKKPSFEKSPWHIP